MNRDIESAQSPDTHLKEMVKASNELKKLMRIRDGRRKYVDEMMNNLEEVLNAGNKFQKKQKKGCSVGGVHTSGKTGWKKFGSDNKI